MLRFRRECNIVAVKEKHYLSKCNELLKKFHLERFNFYKGNQICVGYFSNRRTIIEYKFKKRKEVASIITSYYTMNGTSNWKLKLQILT